MGQSGRSAIGDSLGDHIDYLTALLDALGLTDIVVAPTTRGTAICLDCLRRQPDRVRSVAAATMGWARNKRCVAL